jgi:hypothetical protein
MPAGCGRLLSRNETNRAGHAKKPAFWHFYCNVIHPALRATQARGLLLQSKTALSKVALAAARCRFPMHGINASCGGVHAPTRRIRQKYFLMCKDRRSSRCGACDRLRFVPASASGAHRRNRDVRLCRTTRYHKGAALHLADAFAGRDPRETDSAASKQTTRMVIVGVTYACSRRRRQAYPGSVTTAIVAGRR